jgi:nitrogenase molybdenum-iron protein alpha chain
MGVPCKQLHSYDYSGPYAAFSGAINFYREVDRMLTTKVWKYITPSWEKAPLAAVELVHASKLSSEAKNEAKTLRRAAKAAAAEEGM